MFLLTGCGGDFGDSSDTFYVEGEVLIPSEFDISFSDLYIQVLGAKEKELIDIVEIGRNGRFGFTTDENVYLTIAPVGENILDRYEGYKFTPESIKINSKNKKAVFKFRESTYTENEVELDIATKLSSSYSNSKEFIELELTEDDKEVTFKDLVEREENSLSLTKSSFNIFNPYGDPIRVYLEEMKENDILSIDLNNNTFEIDLNVFADYLLDNKDFNIHALDNQQKFMLNLNFVSKDKDIIYTNKIIFPLSEDGFFNFVVNVYENMRSVFIGSESVGENILDFVKSMPLYKNTSIDIKPNNNADDISTDDFVINDEGFIVGKGMTDLSIILESSTYEEKELVITITVTDFE